MLSFKEILMQYLKDKKNEEAPVNSVAGGGVSMPPDAVQDKKKKKEIMTRLGTTVKENKETNSVLLNQILDQMDKIDVIVDEKSYGKNEIEFVEEPVKKSVLEKANLTEQTPAQKATQMLKNLAIVAGYKRPSSGDGYQAIWDYRNGKGKFQGKGKKTFKQVQDWIYRNGYRIDMGYLKDMLGEETIKEYGTGPLGSIGLGGGSYGAMHPIASLGDTPPKGRHRTMRSVGLVSQTDPTLKKEISIKLKGKVLDRKIKRFTKKFRQNLKDRKP